jgi:hypothetical protein
MASALAQPARPLSTGQSVPTAGGSPSPFNFDINQLLAMLLSSEQQKQMNLIDAARTPVSPIVKDPRSSRISSGLAGWYEMNPQAQQGQSYQQSQQAQQSGIRRNAAMNDVSSRIGLAELLQQLESLNVQSLDNSVTPRTALPYNPFYS